MDVRLPAQLRRPLQVPGPVCFVSQIGQAAPVDPLGPARPLQRPVRRLLPRLAGLLQPVPGLGLPRLPRPPPSPGPVGCSAGTTARRCARSRHGPARRTSDAHGDFLRSCRPGGSPAYRAAAPRPSAARRSARQPPAARPRSAPWARRTGSRCTACRWRARARPPPPSTLRGRPRPLRHVSVLFVFQFLPVLLVTPLALDVIALGAGRLPPGAGTETSFKMKDCHALMPLLLIVSTPFHKVKRE